MNDEVVFIVDELTNSDIEIIEEYNKKVEEETQRHSSRKDEIENGFYKISLKSVDK